MNDLKVHGVFNLCTVASPVLGKAWKALRVSYAKQILKKYKQSI
jgi:hypothetical protein